MEAMWRKATGQFLFSPTPMSPRRRIICASLCPGSHSRCRLLTCLPRGIEARTLGGKMIALHYGFNFCRNGCLRSGRPHPLAIGHPWRSRAVLEQLDGFKHFLNHLADDYELGHRVSQLGLRVIVPPLLLDCVMPAESFAARSAGCNAGNAHPPFTRRAISRCRCHLPGFWALILALLQPFAGGRGADCWPSF